MSTTAVDDRQADKARIAELEAMLGIGQDDPEPHLAVEEEGRLVSRPMARVHFWSRRRNLRLVKVPRYPILAAGSNRQVGEHPGEVVAFSDGQFTVPLDGAPVRLEDGREVEADEVLTWLRTHQRYLDSEDGFWEVDQTAPAPSQEELEIITDAAITGDLARLREFWRQETTGWNREGLVNLALSAMSKVEELQERRATEAAEEAERIRAVATAEAESKARADAKKAAKPAAASKAAGAEPGVAPETAPDSPGSTDTKE